MTARDSVLIASSGSVSSKDPGLAVFLNPSDLENIPRILGASTSVVMDGLTSGVVAGNIVSTSQGFITFSKPDAEGDSGGGFLLNYSQKQYVLGTLSGYDTTNSGSMVTAGPYLTYPQWTSLNNKLAQGVSGDKTKNQPTNLVVGSSDADTINGSSRSDILLGEGGNDTITASNADIVNGGGGNDKIVFTPTNGENEAMTARFAVNGGSDVVETSSMPGTYALDLIGLNMSDVSIIAGGYDTYSSLNSGLDYVQLQFITFKDTATDDEITFVNQAKAVGTNSQYDSSKFGISYISNNSPISSVKFSDGTTLNAAQIWSYVGNYSQNSNVSFDLMTDDPHTYPKDIPGMEYYSDQYMTHINSTYFAADPVPTSEGSQLHPNMTPDHASALVNAAAVFSGNSSIAYHNMPENFSLAGYNNDNHFLASLDYLYRKP